ncbi:MAG: hypothetical protein EU548_03070 [Promethearchaeota archaeon]|nr:MAG: hypothetical protein EU548_03070 [Candidatus Lokiarchaeota archaeon]
MRGSIKIISLVFTLSLFILLNIFWFIVNPSGESLSTSDPTYYIVLVIVLGAILAIAIYMYTKSRRKKRVRL